MLSTAKAVSTNLLSTAVNRSQMKEAAAAAFVVFGPRSWASWTAGQSGSDMVIGCAATEEGGRNDGV